MLGLSKTATELLGSEHRVQVYTGGLVGCWSLGVCQCNQYWRHRERFQHICDVMMSLSLMNNGLQKTQYIRILESMTLGGGIGAELPWIRPFSRYIPIQKVQEIFRSQDFVLEYGNRAVNNARADSGNKTNLFASILNEVEKEEGSLTDMDIRCEAANMIIAGIASRTF